MTVRALRRVVTGAVALAVVVAPSLTTTATAAGVGHSSRISTSNFPDPGFAKFGTRYYLYRTGGLFGATSSTSPQKGYGAIRSAMTSVPRWVSKSDPKLWAPDVFAVRSSQDPTYYVMYYTGQSASKGVHCIGVATSTHPASGFVDHNAAPVICAPQAGYEAIDPSMYLAQSGKRYMLYKTNYQNKKDFKIRALPMDASGTKKAGASRVKIAQSTKMEAPSAIVHGNKVWIFTSRGDYANCTYSTDVWSASSLWGGTFKRVKTVMSSASTGLCGPGGATVLQDGSTTRIAFHAWKGGSASSKVRVTWVGTLRWTKSGPSLY